MTLQSTIELISFVICYLLSLTLIMMITLNVIVCVLFKTLLQNFVSLLTTQHMLYKFNQLCVLNNESIFAYRSKLKLNRSKFLHKFNHQIPLGFFVVGVEMKWIRWYEFVLGMHMSSSYAMSCLWCMSTETETTH